MPPRYCVYCASSNRVDDRYLDAARIIGEIIAGAGCTVVYGGGASGLMGQLADGALARGGDVIGIIPRFMDKLEWGHAGLTELVSVDDMHERKRLMADRADAIIALPGGCGTLEELAEVLTWKRLGLYLNPIILVNINGYYDPLITLLENMVSERFMDPRHLSMWSVVSTPGEVLAAIANAPRWNSEAVGFAVPR
jgi:uncharacterized protein (TIGR00730 family)